MTFFEVQLLPLVELDGVDFVLVHQCGHRDAVDQTLKTSSRTSQAGTSQDPAKIQSRESVR